MQMVNFTLDEEYKEQYYILNEYSNKMDLIEENVPKEIRPNVVDGTVDQAMANPLGGIDFNAANLDLQIKRDGRGVPLPWLKQDMAQLSRIQGFEPEIIEIKPAVNVPIISELRQKLQSRF